MYVVILSFHLVQLSPEVLTHTRKDFSQPTARCFIQYVPSIFRHKDQVDMHNKNTVPASPYVLTGVHGPSMA